MLHLLTLKELKYFLFLNFLVLLAAFTQTGKSVQSSWESLKQPVKIVTEENAHIKAFAILNYIHYLLKLHAPHAITALCALILSMPVTIVHSLKSH